MTPRILGLHHVTATVDDAQADLDFCIELLGMRLVKKTVNFDNRNVYHFYYGNERGEPGTIWTTFPYKGYGVRVGAKGAGQVVTTAFSVPVGSLEFWRNRLQHAGVAFNDVEAFFGEPAIAFNDPSGLRFELIATNRDSRQPWAREVADDAAIRGIHSVQMLVRSAEPSVEFATSVLGYRVVQKTDNRTRLAVNGDIPGRIIDIIEDPGAKTAVNGLGTVHHVAMAIGTAEEQLALRDELMRLRVAVTDVRDRCYFTSIYFREPGGVLYEVATMKPGFAVDEPVESLGRDLKLPAWEEPHRASIEKNLATVSY
ncbi:MAG TPA: ring-cleaving dioxygenase [Vicinamibacterales bacterium]|nr:ring-cleaving dioxygenase [Vicinamibacterales bacterium]